MNLVNKLDQSGAAKLCYFVHVVLRGEGIGEEFRSLQRARACRLRTTLCLGFGTACVGGIGAECSTAAVWVRASFIAQHVRAGHRRTPFLFNLRREELR